MGIGSSCGSVYGEKGDARQAPHFVVRSLPVALFIYPRSDWGSRSTRNQGGAWTPFCALPASHPRHAPAGAAADMPRPPRCQAKNPVGTRRGPARNPPVLQDSLSEIMQWIVVCGKRYKYVNRGNVAAKCPYSYLAQGRTNA